MRVILLIIGFCLACLAPANAAEDGTAARNTIRSQVEAFGRDDTASAYSYAAPSIQEMFPQAETFMNMVRRGYAPVYRHKSFEFGEMRRVDGKIEQDARIIDADGMAWEALYTLEEQPDGSLKISGCVLKAIGQTA